jgi:hypothetical protein
MLKLKNKKAIQGDVYLSPWMFIVWVIIVVSILIGVWIFLNSITDSRRIEASVLTIRILDCLKDNFDYAKITDPNFDLYTKCNLDKKMFEETTFYYINLTIKPLFSGKPEYSFTRGENFQVECETQAQANKAMENFPQCYSDSLIVYDKNGGEYLLLSQTASNQK